LEAIVALPTDMFYNTGIATYVWILTNHKAANRKGKVQLINGAEFFQKMRKSLGAKRKELGDADIERIVKLYGDFETNEWSRVFDNEDFGYRTITVERPLRLNFAVTPERIARIDESTALTKLGKQLPKLKEALGNLGATKVWTAREPFQQAVRKAVADAKVSLMPPQFKALLQALSERDETAEVCKDSKGNPEPDADLRDTENVPLKDDVQAYFVREVLPHVRDAWIDHDKTKVGYEIAFNRYFYKYVPPRPLDEIDRDLKALAGEIMGLLGEVTA
jgi:type I restriction enzyme M protein